MRVTLLCFISLFAGILLAQETFPAQPDLQTQMETQACPYDSMETIVQPQYWEVYQTQDDNWDGPRDSTRCLSFRQAPNGQWVLDLNTTDPQRNLFFRYRQAFEFIYPNSIYRTDLRFRTTARLRYAEDCAEANCSSLTLVYDAYDQSRDTLVERVFTGTISGYDGPPCLVTDNVEELIVIKEYVVAFNFSEASWAEQTFEPRDFSSSLSYFDVEPLTTLPFPENTRSGNQLYGYIHSLVPNPTFGYYLIQQSWAEHIPGDNHITYVEAYPDFPVSEQLDINLQLEHAVSLAFQPYTGLRGGLVDGSDTLRHKLIISAEWDDTACDLFIVELPVPGNTTYLFQTDTLRFGGPQGCFMVQDGGKLAIDQNAQFVYGQGGMGMLGLGKDAQIELREASSLQIENTAVLVWHDESVDPQAYVDLAAGSKLIFAEGSHLQRMHNETMYLNVYMNGGELDDSALSPEERQLIRRIYPPTELPVDVAMQVVPNPVGAQNMLWVATTSDSPLPYRVYYSDGRLLERGEAKYAQPGRFSWTLPQGLQNGLYWLEVQLPEGPVMVSFVR